MREVDFTITIERLESLIDSAKQAIENTDCDTLYFDIRKPLRNKEFGESEEKIDYFTGKFDISRERNWAKKKKLSCFCDRCNRKRRQEQEWTCSPEMREHIEKYHTDKKPPKSKNCGNCAHKKVCKLGPTDCRCDYWLIE